MINNKTGLDALLLKKEKLLELNKQKVVFCLNLLIIVVVSSSLNFPRKNSQPHPNVDFNTKFVYVV